MTTTRDISYLLAGVPFLADLPREILEELAGGCRLVRLEKNDHVFRDGEPASAAFILSSGRVAVAKSGPDGKQQILKVWEAGQLFGEVALFGEPIYPASAQALEDCVVIRLPKTALRAVLMNKPEVGLAIMGAMAGRMRHLVGLVEELSLKEVPARLAAWLLEHAGADDLVTLDISRQRLAARLGTIPETLSRIQARLVRDGLIKLEGRNQILILDREALGNLSGRG